LSPFDSYGIIHATMAVNVQVTKSTKENTSTTIRRFTKRMQQSGVLPRVRGRKFFKRSKSPFVKKKAALRGIEKKEKFETLSKMGKLPPARGRRR